MERNPDTGNGGSHTFGQFLEEFRTDFGGWSRNTWRGLSGMLRKLDEEFGNRPLESITTREVERYLTRRRNVDGITTATANRYLATLKTLFKTACNWDYISDDPTSRLKMLKEQSRIPEALSESELDARDDLLSESNPSRGLFRHGGHDQGPALLSSPAAVWIARGEEATITGTAGPAGRSGLRIVVSPDCRCKTPMPGEHRYSQQFPVVSIVVTLLGDPDTTTAELEAVLVSDAAIVHRLLRVVNSPVYTGAPRGRSRSLKEAMVRLGQVGAIAQQIADKQPGASRAQRVQPAPVLAALPVGCGYIA